MTLYIINHCNEWHEYASFRLIGIVDAKHLGQIKKKIKRECKYNDDEFQTYIDISPSYINNLDI